MANIREFHDFKGDDVILLWLTREELPVLRQALDAVRESGGSAITLAGSRLILRKHRATGVNLSKSEAEICLTDGAAEELAGLVDGLLLDSEPGHQYMDIGWPVPTLMISVDEYPADFGDDR